MFEFKLAYRHEFVVEGFTGSGLTRTGARTEAIRKASEKCEHTPHPFRMDRLILNDAGLTVDEKKTIRADWKID